MTAFLKLPDQNLENFKKFKEYIEENLIQGCFLQLNERHSDIYIFLGEINIAKLPGGSWDRINLWHCYFKYSVKD